MNETRTLIRWQCEHCSHIEVEGDDWKAFCRATYDHVRDNHPDEWTATDQAEYERDGYASAAGGEQG